MGIERNLAEFLISAPQFDVSFDETCTLGRQDLLIRPSALEPLLRKYDRLPDDFHKHYPWNRPKHTGDPLLRILGARQVESLDSSDYDGATLIHDLNAPIPAEWKERFTVVLDGGHSSMFSTSLQA